MAYGQPQIDFASIVNQAGGNRYGSPASNQQQGNGMAQQQQPNWGAALQFAQGMNDMNTPFHVGQVKNAFGAHANALSGLGSQIGSQLNANADRGAQAKQQAVGWAQGQNVIPFEFADLRSQPGVQNYGGVKMGAPDQFSTWQKMNEQYQNNRADLARQNQMKDQMQQFDPTYQQALRNQQDTARQQQWNDLPLQQERMKMMQGLLGNLFSGMGGMFGQVNGGTPATPTRGFTTNFGASGTV